MSRIEHPNLIRYHKSFVEEENLYIVMEYAEEGDLQKLIERQKLRKRYFAEKDLWAFAWQIALAILHMHANDVIHRDI